MKTQSQEKAILQYLESGKSLTQLEALPLFGSFRLGARVYELIRKGHPIKSQMIKTGTGKRVAQYSMN